jgi:hypothetical protein
VDIALKPKKVAWTFSLAVVFLTIVNIPAQYININFGRVTAIRRVASFFDVNGEGNIPALFSSLTLLFSAALLGVIARSKREAGDTYARHWFCLALIFLFLSVDEAVSLHEFAGHLWGLVVDTSSERAQYGWLVPYGILMCVFLLAYLKFLGALPRRTRRLFVVSGLVFVAGAWGGVLLAGGIVPPGTGGALVRVVLYSVEEFMEMAGIVVFIYALASYMASEVRESVIRITPWRKPLGS